MMTVSNLDYGSSDSIDRLCGMLRTHSKLTGCYVVGIDFSTVILPALRWF